MQISAMQKAVRSYQNLENKVTGAALTQADIVGTGKLVAVLPTCPSGGSYTLAATIPDVGTAALTCNQAGHAPADVSGW
jgi:hypothetical protein